MSPHDQRWNRLTGLARSAPEGAAAIEMPLGFSTRVAARWLEMRREGFTVVSPWEVLAVRALAVACLITVGAAVAAWPVVTGEAKDEIADVADPLTAEVLPL